MKSEVLQCQAAEDAAVALRTTLTELKVGLVHGRLKAAEKQTSHGMISNKVSLTC